MTVSPQPKKIESKTKINKIFKESKVDIHDINDYMKSLSNKKLNTGEIREVCLKLKKAIPYMNLSNLKYALNSLTFMDNEKSDFVETKLLLLSQLNKFAENCSPEDLSNILVSLTRLHYQWKNILKESPQFSLKLMKSMQNMNAKNVGHILWGIGSMGMKWNENNELTKSAIICSIEKQCQNFRSYQLSSVIWAMAKVGMSWNSLSISTKASMISKLVSSVEELSPQQASKTLWALGNLGISYKEFPIEVIEQLVLIVNTVKREDIGYAVPASQTVTGLSKMGMPWSSFPSRMQHLFWEQIYRICLSNNYNGISNAVWACGTIGRRSALI
jgi:hypothetical protein